MKSKARGKSSFMDTAERNGISRTDTEETRAWERNGGEGVRDSAMQLYHQEEREVTGKLD